MQRTCESLRDFIQKTEAAKATRAEVTKALSATYREGGAMPHFYRDLHFEATRMAAVGDEPSTR